MKQFEKMGWIRQGFLGLIVCAVMSPSHAMSVRERYLLNHPQVTHPVVEKESTSAHVVKHSKKHRAVEKTVAVHHKISHQKIEQPIEKNTHVTQAKKHHARAIIPKHTHSRLDKQQARDAEAALKRPRLKVKQVTPSRHKHHLAATPIKKQVTRHAVKHKVEHRVRHQKHHRAE
jgi:hypothetical protein